MHLIGGFEVSSVSLGISLYLHTNLVIIDLRSCYYDTALEFRLEFVCVAIFTRGCASRWYYVVLEGGT